jgi:hypothetical protein
LVILFAQIRSQDFYNSSNKGDLGSKLISFQDWTKNLIKATQTKSYRWNVIYFKMRNTGITSEQNISQSEFLIPA